MMSRTVKFAEATRQTERLENQFVRTLESSYRDALNDIDTQLRRDFSRYSVDGKWSYDAMQQMTTYERQRVTRLQRLERLAQAELATINRGKRQKLQSHLTKAYEMNYKTAGQTLNNVARTSVSFDRFNREAIYAASIRPMADIALEEEATMSRRRIRRAIRQSVTQGESIDDMADRVTQAMGRNANNAVRIARTETTGIMGQARRDMLREARDEGIEVKKVWLSTSDDRTRESHDDIDGVEVDIDETFPNGLEYPGDDGGEAEEVVNCRCAMAARVISVDGEPV